MSKLNILLYNNKGAILILSFMVLLALTGIVTAYLFITGVTVKSSGFRDVDDKAFWLAEAGINKAIWYLIDNSEWRSETGTVETLGAGSYNIVVEDSGDNVLITSYGEIGDIERTLEQEVVISSGSSTPVAFNDVVYANTTIDISGATNLNITGTQTSSGADLPTVDFAVYYDLAPVAQRVSGNKTFNSGVYSGIWYIDGNASIRNSVTINGTIVATGSISATSRNTINITASSNYPALIANNTVDFKNTSTITIDGLIYGGADGSGDSTLQGSSDVNITGTIISGDATSFKNSNNVTVAYDVTITSDPPPGITGSGGGGGGTVTLAADGWNEL